MFPLKAGFPADSVVPSIAAAARLLNGTLAPTAGTFWVMGKPYDDPEVRRIAATICETARMYESLGVRGNLRFFAAKYDITGWEGEILSLLIQVKTNKRIADSLFISERTVDTHVYNIFRKCDVKNRVELAAPVKRFETTT